MFRHIFREQERRRNDYIKKAEFTVLVPSAIPMKTHTIIY
jgi:hypothetical protein